MAHLYEQGRFAGDMDFHKNTTLPILTGTVEFYNDFLIERDGYLVTAPVLRPRIANLHLTVVKMPLPLVQPRIVMYVALQPCQCFFKNLLMMD